MDSVVVSVRIKSAIKRKLEDEGIDVQTEIKEYLTQRASQLEMKGALDRIEKIIREGSKPSKSGFAVKSIREDRNADH